jgi:hypothetical protein
VFLEVVLKIIAQVIVAFIESIARYLGYEFI